MVEGRLHGPSYELDHSARLTAEGCYQDNVRVGSWKFYFADGGWLEGPVDDTGTLSGPNVTYHYPDSEFVLHGTWDAAGLMQSARFMPKTELDARKRKRAGPRTEVYRHDTSTATRLSKTPLQADAYEAQQSFVAPSSIAGAGRGLFAKKELPAGRVVALYNGLRLSHAHVDRRNWELNDNTITLVG